MTRIYCLDEIIEKNSEILILGTIPGTESMSKKQYYANPNNYFWDIMFRILDDGWGKYQHITTNISYSDKTNLLLRNKIALWDVIASCEREGNSDKKIKDEEINNFETFFENNSGIKRIIFNGKSPLYSSEYFFKKKYPKLLHQLNISHISLNSTSSQNPNNPFYILNEWMQTIKT